MTQDHSHYRAVVRGIGAYLPERILTNTELSETVDTSDEWIRTRSGIAQRHIAAEGEFTSDLAVKAARDALNHANMKAEEIDLIVVATTTPDYTFPSTATIVQEKLGIHHGAAFDIQAVCSGFIYAMKIVNSMIKTGAARNVLVIGAETFSRLLDWDDRSTCVLFGDGAGAFILTGYNHEDAVAFGGGDAADVPGIMATFIRSDGRHKDLLYVDGGPSVTKTVGHVRMIGNQVFRYAVRDISAAMEEAARRAGIEVTDIDWFVPHQANQRILDGVAKKLKIDPKSVISTVAQHANTSAASVPLAFHTAVNDTRIKRGHTVMLEAFGGGFTWGATLLRY